MACFPAISWALVHLWFSCVVHGDVRRHPRISGILMESRHPVADGGAPTRPTNPSGAEIRTGAWAERFLVGALHPSHVCHIGESDQGLIVRRSRYSPALLNLHPAHSSGRSSRRIVRYEHPFPGRIDGFNGFRKAFINPILKV